MLQIQDTLVSLDLVERFFVVTSPRARGSAALTAMPVLLWNRERQKK